MTASARLRFAPSPNGALHLGHALSALLNQEAARRLKGENLLRLEDIDRERCTADKERRLLADLAWMSALPKGDPLRQSERFAVYEITLRRLRAMGLLYPCFASRGEIAAACGPDAPRDPDGAFLYPGLWRDASTRRIDEARAGGKPFSWRLDVARALCCLGQNADALHWLENEADGLRKISARPQLWGDVVLARKDTPASYHLAVVIDDAEQGITHVLRGQDLFHATSLHALLQALLGLPRPIYRHHRLILGADGRKLSKSAAANGLQALREAGKTPADILDMIAWNPDEDLAGLALSASDPQEPQPDG